MRSGRRLRSRVTTLSAIAGYGIDLARISFLRSSFRETSQLRGGRKCLQSTAAASSVGAESISVERRPDTTSPE